MVPAVHWSCHDDVIRWKHFLCYWPFVRGIPRWSVNSPHKGQWCGALMFFLICTWTNGCANHRDAGDLRRHHAHYDATVMFFYKNHLTHWILKVVKIFQTIFLNQSVKNILTNAIEIKIFSFRKKCFVNSICKWIMNWQQNCKLSKIMYPPIHLD